MSETHLVGQLDVTALAGTWPQITDFGTPPWELGLIDVVHINYETTSATMLSTLPPAVHPSIPPHLSWLVYRVHDSDLGPFQLAQTRIGCRIGLKPRGLLTSAVCDSPMAVKELERRWGFRVRLGQIRVTPRNDHVNVRVAVDAASILAVDIEGPVLLPGSGVPIAPGLNLANTPLGRQLVQVDPEYVIASAERGTPRLRHFDAAAWGATGVTPNWPISGVWMQAEVTLPALRFVTDPASRAVDGTVRLPDSRSG
ncbi:hypothetical protein [Sporichthya sp.]|uniref:hypothetical protein n=1 Tax=Sporichthya sp. TaxID=65475 RepID=UPI0017D9A220|nr:hypothetical protein [Sporichthya sp.]MBA3743131.1 hypothetical protein [Sporichthya sp.]